MARTEDEVRDAAKTILGFDKIELDVQQGTGQITTFNQLGFKGVSDKPDGWYLPKNRSNPAIVLETKSENEDVNVAKWMEELTKNIKIVAKKYSKVIGILYNGTDVRVLKFNGKEDKLEELADAASTLQEKNYYLQFFREDKIDKQKIYRLTKRINDCLHYQFGIKNLYHRMIFTACAVIAKKLDAMLIDGMRFSVMTESIQATLDNSLREDIELNSKLKELSEVYKTIELNNSANQEDIDNFIAWVSDIADSVNSDNWNGEDVMGIFFNEFNRYKPKTENGQVFTPDHITSFMYHLLDVHSTDRVLDATCGSGAFLVKAMCNMIKESGGVNTAEAKEIKQSQLFGIEMDKEIYALACANMLIHRDGKTNLIRLDTRKEEACKWIAEKEITKVLMNPPYERKCECMKIVQNVLDSVPEGAKCAFILPEKKLEKDYRDKKYGNKVLKKHKLTHIIKLPENLFFGIGITTSIFVFEAGRPQNGSNIIGYYIEDDGLETVKNQGRQDIKNRWPELEAYWIKAIRDGVEERYGTRQIINPSEHLSYQMAEKPFEVFEEDFIKTAMDYVMFKQGIDAKEFKEHLIDKVMYIGKVQENKEGVRVEFGKED